MGSSAIHRPAYRRLCRKLRTWRAEVGMTQRDLAARLRRPQSYVFKCEAGERRLDPLEFAEWCCALGREPSAALRDVLSIG